MGIVRKKVVIYCISSETLNDPGIRSMLYMCVLCTADYGSNVMFFCFFIFRLIILLDLIGVIFVPTLCGD
jgi:hypothetical protein